MEKAASAMPMEARLIPWRKVLYAGLAISSLVMFTILYLNYGSNDLISETNRYHEVLSSVIRTSSFHNKGKENQQMYSSLDKTKNQSILLEPVSPEWRFHRRNNIQNIITNSRKSTPVAANYRTSAKYISPVKSIKDTFRGSHVMNTPKATILTNGPAAKRCTPRTNIVFFKMHKCSSSTVQNILFRFGEERSLDFVLPPAGNYLGHSYFKRSSMMNFPVKEYNILCHHTMFSHTAMEEVMSPDTIFVTILRDPVPMFESIFTYQHMSEKYHLPPSRGLELFLEMPDVYYKMSDGGILHARNPMLYNLGLPKWAFRDTRKTEEKIDKLRSQLDLVMMTEYFEESLILLRDLMCWELDDIVYFVLNARSKSSVKPVSPTVAAKIRKWNNGDVKLYETFNRTFWSKVKEFGEDRMKEEVTNLRARNQYFSKRCIAQVINKDSNVWHPPGIYIDSFRLKPEALNNSMCVRMARTELPYTEHIRRIQQKRYML